MPEKLDLKRLSEIAKAATPGPWELEYDNADDYEAGINDGDYPNVLHGPRNCSFDHWTNTNLVQDQMNRVSEISEMVDEDAKFIAAFDPPTVLALLAVLEKAQQERDAALDAIKRWAHRSSRETTELRKANASIDRVKALRNTWCEASYDPCSRLNLSSAVRAIDRALESKQP